MKKYFMSIAMLLALSKPVKADFWGGDIPLLIEIVANTLKTLHELERQSAMLEKELRGIDDKINRFKTIQEIIRPDDLAAWKDPREALRRLQRIYYQLPPEFKTEKSDEVERRLSEAMKVAGTLTDTSAAAFQSGKQLEHDALEAGPAVAQKMGASGIGSLIVLQSQQQAAQATVISLLSQMIAEEGSKEVSRLKTQAREYKMMGEGMTGFSRQIRLLGVSR